MEGNRTAPAQGGPDTADSNINVSTPKDPTKLERVLAYLSSGRSLHRFEAEREVNDHCLHSTMSIIKNDLGIPYRKITVKVPCWRGHLTTVAKYWFESESQHKADDRVRAMRKQRGAIQ